MGHRPIILNADDNLVHIRLLQHVFGNSDSDFRIQVVRDGKQVVDYLSRNPATDLFDEYPTPDLLLLDLDMPNLDGFQVLQWIRAEPKYKELPVVILSASSDREDMRKAYALGANGYLVKPFSKRDYEGLVEQVRRFLLEMKDAPPRQ